MTDSNRGLKTPTEGKCGFRGFRQASQQQHLTTASIRILGAFAKLRKQTTGFVMSVRRPPARPHQTARLPPDGFSPKLIFEYSSKICLKI
jgi:hypothetical protein